MKLNKLGIEDRQQWVAAGYEMPAFDRAAMMNQTKHEPEWVHFGAGNIFRAFQANVAQQLLNREEMKSGIVAAEGFDYEIIEKMNKPHSDLSILVTLKADGSIKKTVVASIAESLELNRLKKEDFDELCEIFTTDSLKMASFTITEKGYNLTNASGEYYPDVQKDMEEGPSMTNSYIGKVVSLLYVRYQAGKKPLALVSMDNCSHNGDKLRDAILPFAREWEARKLVWEGFATYLENPDLISFPWTMIDKITPRPDAIVEKTLDKDCIEEMDAVITSKNTYVAPFVNAEESQYLVIEDAFPNGKLPLDKAGIIYTDRETVDKVEKMKVCTCLNPLHTALAVFGCLLGYDRICEEMKDEILVKLIRRIGYTEGLPVVVNPGILDPKEFINTVVGVRLPNPFMPDTPQRIATDTSQKLAIRFGKTVQAYCEDETLDVATLIGIPLVYAGWLRYLMGINDEGETFEISPDPMIDTLQESMKQMKHGNTDAEQIHTCLFPILSDTRIFGVDLYEVKLGERVEQYFAKMNAECGAIRKTLANYLTFE